MPQQPRSIQSRQSFPPSQPSQCSNSSSGVGSSEKPPSQFVDRTDIVFLYHGEITKTATHIFEFGQPVPTNLSSDELASYYNVKEHVPRNNNIISKYETRFGSQNCSLFVEIYFEFKELPGAVLYNLTIIDDEQRQRHMSIEFHVIGVVLYQQNATDLNILTGKSRQPLYLPEPHNDVQEIVVKSQVYNAIHFTETGVPWLDVTEIQLSAIPDDNETDADTRELLPWSKSDCSINAELDSLNDRCAMTFSEDFTSFKLRIANNRRLDFDVKLQIEWEGLRTYAAQIEGDENGISGSNPDELPEDDISFVVIKPYSAEANRLVAGALAPWKIAVAVIVAFLVVAAAVTLVCCCVCGRVDRTGNSEPLSKRISVIFNQVAMGLGVRPRGCRDDDDDMDNFYVEKPSSEDTSTVLMLEGSVRRVGIANSIMMAGRAGGLDDDLRVEPAYNVSKEDMGAERLVLPRAVTRGIDLEPSTDDESNRFPFSEDDVYFAHGMTSAPEEMFEGEEGEGDGRYATMKRERSSANEEDSELTEVETTIDRSGVGAAIHRVRQVDLLHGPASKGLVGRNGEPPQESPADKSKASACPFSVSTVS